MKTMNKQLDWFTVAMWALVAFGLALNPLFWILAVIGIGAFFVIIYGVYLSLGVPGAILAVLFISLYIFLSRKF